eukprot:gene6124-9183_t
MTSHIINLEGKQLEPNFHQLQILRHQPTDFSTAAKIKLPHETLSSKPTTTPFIAAGRRQQQTQPTPTPGRRTPPTTTSTTKLSLEPTTTSTTKLSLEGLHQPQHPQPNFHWKDSTNHNIHNQTFIGRTPPTTTSNSSSGKCGVTPVP